MRGLFVTGTDTNVGKTWAAVRILTELRAAGLRAGAYKPACSGAERDPDGRPFWSDVVRLREALDGQVPDDRVCPQCFEAPLAPPQAARLENRRVDEGLLRAGIGAWDGLADFVLVEGAGGWYSPLSEGDTNADVARDLGFPVLVVARPGLGTINHTLLTVAAIRQSKLPIAGVVVSAADSSTAEHDWETNARDIERFGRVRVLGGWTYQGSVLRRQGAAVTIAWQDLFGPKDHGSPRGMDFAPP